MSKAPLHKDLHAAQAVVSEREAEVARITSAIAALDTLAPPDPTAVVAAQERVEHAAAALHLGEGSREELDAASAELDQARSAIERAARDHADVEATRAGLQRRLEAAQAAVADAQAIAAKAKKDALYGVANRAELTYIRCAEEISLAVERVRAAQSLLSRMGEQVGWPGGAVELPPIGPLSGAAHRQNAPGTSGRITRHVDPAAVRQAIEDELAGAA
jgi:hypothetical protein